MQYKEFELANQQKLELVCDGDGRNPGIGWNDLDKIAVEYDKRGGLILKGKRKVKNGIFYNFKLRKEILEDDQKVVYMIKVDNKEVEVPADGPMPLEIQAAELLEKARAEKEGLAEEELDVEAIKKATKKAERKAKKSKKLNKE